MFIVLRSHSLLKKCHFYKIDFLEFWGSSYDTYGPVCFENFIIENVQNMILKKIQWLHLVTILLQQNLINWTVTDYGL